MRKLMGLQIHGVQVFPGVETAIAQLYATGATLAILSSNAQSNVLKVLGPHLSAHFSYFECSSPILRKRARLTRLIARTGFNAAEAMLIGDELRDAYAAKRASVPFGAVSWGYTALETLLRAGAHEYFLSPGEMAIKLRS